MVEREAHSLSLVSLAPLYLVVPLLVLPFLLQSAAYATVKTREEILKLIYAVQPLSSWSRRGLKEAAPFIYTFEAMDL